MGIGVDALTFDPHNYVATTDLQIATLVYDTLIGTDPATFELVPRLATAWEAVDDTTWRFRLREDAVFSDGTPFNAEAVLFNIERGIESERAATYLGAVASVNVVDDFTVDILTNGPSAALTRNLSVAILSMVSPAAAQASDDYLVANPVGTGPYLLQEWVPRERIVVVRNPDYWGEPVLLDEATFFPITDDSTRLTSYQAGDIDVMINPPLEAVATLEADPESVVTLSPVTRTVWLGFNVQDEALQNEQLRQAIAAAVDRPLLTDTVTEGLMRPAVGLVPPEVLEPSFELPLPYDPTAAQELLAEAGYADGLTLQFWTPQGRYPKDRAVAEAIQGMLSEVGITVELSVVEWGPYNESLANHEQQLYLIGWGFASGDPDGGLRQIAYSTSIFNYTNVQDEAVDGAIDAAAQELDPTVRAKMYNDLQEQLLQRADYIPIYHNNVIVVAKQSVQNFIVNPLEMFDLSTTSVQQ